MKIFLISIFLSVLSFILVTRGKIKLAVLIMIFTIPFYYFPLENSVVHYRLNIGLTGVLVFTIWIALKFSFFNSNFKNIHDGY